MKILAISFILLTTLFSCTGKNEKAGEEVEKVSRYGLYEKTIEHYGSYINPYTETSALATFISPQGIKITVALFWDGGNNWKFRYSPGMEGVWSWYTQSEDEGLNGKSGEFTCIPSDFKGGIKAMKEHPYHFNYEDSTPFWLFGETNWSLFGTDSLFNYSKDTFKAYIDLRASQHFNFIECILTSPPGGNEGGTPFTDKTCRKINPDFFKEVDERIAYMNQKGVTAMIFLSWSSSQKYILPWQDFPDDASRLLFAKYVISRFGSYNVCFGVTGEWQISYRDEYPDLWFTYHQIGKMLFENNPNNRMIAIHPTSLTGTTRDFVNRDWMSFGDYQQNYINLHRNILKSRFKDHIKNIPWPEAWQKPVVNGEYAYYLRDFNNDGIIDKPNSATIENIRFATYDIAMAGGYFVTGWGSTYWGGYQNLRAGFTIHDPIDDIWEKQVQYIYHLFTSFEWWRMEPSDEIIFGDGIAYCLAEKGWQYMVYVRDCREAKLTLDTIGNKKYQVQSYDPRSGSFDDLGIFTDAEFIIQPVDKADYLYLFKVK